jgi:hypothetical protein
MELTLNRPSIIVLPLFCKKGIVSKLTKKFWMCQNYSKMKDYNKKMTTGAVE